MLSSLGRVEQAGRVLAETEKRMSLNGRQYARDNRDWLSGARKDIEAVRQPA